MHAPGMDYNLDMMAALQIWDKKVVPEQGAARLKTGETRRDIVSRDSLKASRVDLHFIEKPGDSLGQHNILSHC